MIILGLLLEVVDLSGANLDNVTRPRLPANAAKPAGGARRPGKRPIPARSAPWRAARVMAKSPTSRKGTSHQHWQRANALRRIPIEVQREGLSLASLQASLRGRWRGLCHPGELGTALRTLGFKRKRRWHEGSGFCGRTRIRKATLYAHGH
jgi:hypothetical protein